MKVRKKNMQTTISTQTSAFTNLDVSRSYDQISHQVWDCVCKFESVDLRCSTAKSGSENKKPQLSLSISSHIFKSDQNRFLKRIKQINGIPNNPAGKPATEQECRHNSAHTRTQVTVELLQVAEGQVALSRTSRGNAAVHPRRKCAILFWPVKFCTTSH